MSNNREFLLLATMTMAMARKMSLENKDLCNCDYFAMILSSHFTMLVKNPITGLV